MGNNASRITQPYLATKNADFFKWRYLDHPSHQYISQVVSWRWNNQVAGVIILRDHGPEKGLELMDLLAPPSAIKQLLQTAQNIATRMKRNTLFCWLTPHVLAALPKPDEQSEITGIHISTPNLQETANQLQANWWLMGGDTDFR